MVRDEIDPAYLKAMDRDEVRFPREVYKIYAAHNLLGLRFPKQYGGRGLNWLATVAVQAEIGVLGTACGCAFVMPDIVGEAMNRFGTDQQKQRYLLPMLKGELVSAEALTEHEAVPIFSVQPARQKIGGIISCLTDRNVLSSVRKEPISFLSMPGPISIRMPALMKG